jgi:hypothetical protein
MNIIMTWHNLIGTGTLVVDTYAKRYVKLDVIFACDCKYVVIGYYHVVVLRHP